MPKKPPTYRPPIPTGPNVVRPSDKARARKASDARRGNSHARGYDRTWAKLRRMHLNSHPFCVFCENKGRVTVATVVDHIIPIAVDPTRRLDDTNLQSLCETCHNSTKQRLDRANARKQTHR